MRSPILYPLAMRNTAVTVHSQKKNKSLLLKSSEISKF